MHAPPDISDPRQRHRPRRGARRWGLGLLLVAAIGLPASAPAVEPAAYANAARLVERLYLYPEEVTPEALLAAAARGASRDVHWLMVEVDGPAVRLSHGDGSDLGTVRVEGWEELPRALQELEQRILGAGSPVGPAEEVRLSILKGMTGALDRYSRIMHGDPKERFERRLTGEREGVGAIIGQRDGRLVVVEVIEGGPAEEAGLQIGDVLLRIDAQATVNMPVSEAVRLISGPEGTQVVLTVQRAGAPHELALTRARFTEPNVRWRVLDDQVGYLHITHVSQRTVDNMLRAMSRLAERDALRRGLVVDLRGNTGGSMKEAARAADVFLTDGLLLRTAGPDGGKVQNLQAEMRAEDTGDEPSIPVVLVVDDRTASGSEILAGALLEHERAAIVGTRTYGKGTVQKIYNIDPEAQLKLTVAQYVLANDRRIAEIGLIPDVVVGRIELDGNGVRYRDFDASLQHTAFERILPHVVEREGWRGQPSERLDLPVEIARRAVLRTDGVERRDLLRSLQRVSGAVRAEQEAALMDALQARGLDWSEAPEPEPSFARARVTLSAAPTPNRVDVYTVRVKVDNLDDTPLHRVLVELSCPTFRAWDGLVLPVGRLEPGESGEGEVQVPLSPGVDLREDVVGVRMRADQRPPLLLDDEVLSVRSSPLPRIAVQARLVPHSAEQEVLHRAQVTVKNLASHPISGVRARFAYPRDLDVELVDLHAQIPVLAPRGTERMDLTLKLAKASPSHLPLDLEVLSERYRTLASWPLSLPVSGEEVTLQAPEIRVRTRTVSAPVGDYRFPLLVTDDNQVDHVVIYANGEKVAWAPGRRGSVDLRPQVQLRPGVNRILVEAVDDQGIKSVRWYYVRGEGPEADAVTAGAGDD